MKKISLSIIVIASFLTIVSPAVALTPLIKEIRNTVKETIKDGRGDGLDRSDIKNEVRENIKEQVKENRTGFLDKVKNFMKKNLRFEARVKGTITVVGSSTFTIEGEEGTFQINITEQTKLLRKFGGKSALDEYAVGNEVVVFGKFTDEVKTIIDAKTVKNNSIQKRRGAFFGKVTVKNNDNFVMETAERGNQTVYFGTAKIIDRKEVDITLTDIKVGDRVRVKGVWDKTLSKINEVDQIKDFSIPVVVPAQTTKN